MNVIMDHCDIDDLAVTVESDENHRVLHVDFKDKIFSFFLCSDDLLLSSLS